eukprot:4029381-Prymnesium_polylepis.1
MAERVTIVTLLTGPICSLWTNLFHTLRRAGLATAAAPIIAHAVGQEAERCVAVADPTGTLVAVKRDANVPPGSDQEARWNTTAFRRVTARKLVVLSLELARATRPVLYLDADVVVIRRKLLAKLLALPPFEYATAKIEPTRVSMRVPVRAKTTDAVRRVRPTSDSVYAQSDHLGFERRITDHCTGMLLLRPTDGARSLLNCSLRALETPGLLAGCDADSCGTRLRTSRGQIPNDQDAFNGCVARLRASSSVGVLDPFAFPNGHRYFKLMRRLWETSRRPPSGVMIVHNNFARGLRKKKARFRQSGLWYAPDPPDPEA